MFSLWNSALAQQYLWLGLQLQNRFHILNLSLYMYKVTTRDVEQR